MPWKAERGHGCPTDEPWAVVNEDSGEVEGCHATEDEALAQVAALYANTEEDLAMADTAAPPEADRAFHAVLVVEGEPTGDGRIIDPGALSWRDLPLPLMWLEEDSHGGPSGTTVPVGRIDRIERTGSVIHGYGVLLGALPAKPGVEALLDSKAVRGISVDLDDVTYVDEVPVEMLEGEMPTPDEDGIIRFPGVQATSRVTDGRVMGATVCAFAAFPQAFIELAPVGADLGPSHEEAVAAAALAIPPGASYTDWLTDPALAAETVAAIVRAAFAGDPPPPPPPPAADEALAAVVITLNGDEFPLADLDPDADLEGAVAALTEALAPFGASVEVRGGEEHEEASEEEMAVVASAGPAHPPAAWFADPGLPGPTALHVADDGRVWGHVATWGVCHIGLPGCTTAPHSPSGYAHYLTGEVLCADGERIAVGQITLGGGHADLSLGSRSAARHYDDAGSAVADVAVGEDAFGIWCAGAVRPDVTPAQVRALRASSPSGDWRSVGGRLEMVAVLAVNVPGFPTVRVASGAPVALVAAGAGPVEGREPRPAPPPDNVRPVMHLIAASIGRDHPSRWRSLDRLVHP